MTYPGDEHHNYDENAPTTELNDTTIESLREKAINLNRYELHSDSKQVEIRQNTDWYGHKALGNLVVGEMTMLN